MQKDLLCVSAPDKGILLYDIRNTEKPVFNRFDDESFLESHGKFTEKLTKRIRTGPFQQIPRKSSASGDRPLFRRRPSAKSAKKRRFPGCSAQQHLPSGFTQTMRHAQNNRTYSARPRPVQTSCSRNTHGKTCEHGRVARVHFGLGRVGRRRRLFAGL